MAARDARTKGRLRAWLDDRAGLDRLVEVGTTLALKPLPKNLSWAYTFGGAAAFFFALQFFTGFLLLMHYAPNAEVAYETVQTIQHRAAFGWLFRQMHSWGASFIVIVLFLHMLKVLWYGSYKRPREFTWFVGVILFALTLTFCFTGYVLPWNQLAKWATNVGAESIGEVPGGDAIKRLVLGGDNVTGSTLGRFFAVHVFLLPLFLGGLLAAHLALVTWKGIAPKLTVKEEEALGQKGALEKVGAEPFFPRQVYRDLMTIVISFALLVTVATFLPWHLGEPASNVTPPGVKPEWYFLPVYQLLKYFSVDFLGTYCPSVLSALESVGLDAHLKFLGIVTVNGFLLVFFLLPVLDRGKQRKIWKRPLFSLLALAALVAVVGLGVLGALSDRTLTIFDQRFHFDIHGFPGDAAAAERPAGAGETGAGTGEADDSSADDPDDPDDSSGDTGTGEAGSSEGETGGPGTGGAGTDGDGEGDGEADAETEEESEEDAETATTDAAAAALPPGGTCGTADCHERQHDDWSESVHAENGIVCVNCHGGNDRSPIEIFAHEGLLTPEGDRARIEVVEFFDDEGATRLRLPEIAAPDDGRQTVGTCTGSGCHGDVLAQFSRGPHLDEDLREIDCQNCHSNHKIAPAGLATYERAATRVYREDNTEDPRAALFTEVRARRSAWEEEKTALRSRIDLGLAFLREVEFPVRYIEEDVEELSEADRAIAVSTHALDPEQVESRIDSAREQLTAIQTEVYERRASIENRWYIVAGVWILTVLSAFFLIRKLRSFRDRPPTSAPPKARPRSPDLDELEETKKFADEEAEALYGAVARGAPGAGARRAADALVDSGTADADDAALDRQLEEIDLEGVDLEGIETAAAELETDEELEFEAQVEADDERIETPTATPAADAALGVEEPHEDDHDARHEIAEDPEPTPAAAVVGEIDEESPADAPGVAPLETPPAPSRPVGDRRSADELTAAAGAALDTDGEDVDQPVPPISPEAAGPEHRTLAAEATTSANGEPEEEKEDGEAGGDGEPEADEERPATPGAPEASEATTGANGEPERKKETGEPDGETGADEDEERR